MNLSEMQAAYEKACEAHDMFQDSHEVAIPMTREAFRCLLILGDTLDDASIEYLENIRFYEDYSVEELAEIINNDRQLQQLIYMVEYWEGRIQDELEKMYSGDH